MRWVRDRLSRKGEGEREKVVYLLSCVYRKGTEHSVITGLMDWKGEWLCNTCPTPSRNTSLRHNLTERSQRARKVWLPTCELVLFHSPLRDFLPLISRVVERYRFIAASASACCCLRYRAHQSNV